jgi:hypothetical protein
MGKFDLSDIKKEPKKNILRQPKPKVEKEQVKKEKKPKAPIGRPKKTQDDRLSKKITVNLTKTEFEKLTSLSEKNFNVPLPKLVRSLLQKDGHI